MNINKVYSIFVSCFVFIGLTSFFLIKLNIIFDDIQLLFFCFFLIFSLGASHGALDHLRGKKIFKPIFKKKWFLAFYPAYILLALLVIFLWLQFPPITLFFFLMISAFHFGEEDLSFFYNGNNLIFYFISFLKGLLVISLSFQYNTETAILFFKYLMVDIANYPNLIEYISIIYFTNIVLLILGSLLILKKELSQFVFFSLEVLLIFFAFYFLPLILAFTLYFCFIHSTKHILRQSKELDNNDHIHGLRLFAIKALPLTIITALGAILFVFYLQDTLVENLIKTIFIGLASLTLPHIILEIIEKKNV